LAKKYVAAIDQGTTSTRFIVFDRQGQIICSNQQEHQQIYPQPGWVEHNPEEIWQRTQSVIKNALEIGNIDPKILLLSVLPTSAKLQLFGTEKLANLTVMRLFGKIPALAFFAIN
jgi:ribulose kinase